MQLQRRSSGLPDWLYVAIVAALGLYFIIGAIAWTIVHLQRDPSPGLVHHDPRHHRGWAGRRARAPRWSSSILAAQPGTTATGGVIAVEPPAS